MITFKTLIITDDVNGERSLSKYLGTPRQKQKHSYLITTLNENILRSNEESKKAKVIYSQLNRMTTVGLKLVEYSTIIDNLKNKIEDSSYNKLKIEFSESNRNLANFIKESINDIFNGKRKIEIEINFIEREVFLKYSLTKENKTKTIKYFFLCFTLINMLIVGALYNLILRKKPRSKVDLFWMSLASNVKTVDEPIIEELEGLGNSIKNPNFSLTKKLKKNSFFPVFSKDWPITFTLVKDVGQLLFFYKSSINGIIGSISAETSYYLPKFDYNSKLIELLIHNIRTLVYGNIIERNNKLFGYSNILYRGGNADGLVYISSMQDTKVILLPHATEFDLFDHNSHKYLFRNYLLSKNVVSKWNSEYAQHTINKAVGRPFYDVLLNKVSRGKFVESNIDVIYKVGIVLTYGTDSEMVKFIDDIISSLSKSNSNIEIYVKHRPNLKHDVSESIFYNKIIDFEGDIIEYLSFIDLNFVGANAVGTVGNVGNDAIVCNVPTIFYFGDRSLSKGELGYSWNAYYEDIAFYSHEQLLASANAGVEGFIEIFNSRQKERRTTLIDCDTEGKSHQKVIQDLASIINE
ncbi:hypothetical protein AB4348_17930 [Vibrio breoganii]